MINKRNLKKIFSLICLPLSLVAVNYEDFLLGNLDGFRPKLIDDGYEIKAKHVFDFYDDFSGSIKSGSAYFGRFQIDSTFDLEKLIDLSGSKISIGAIHQYGTHHYNSERFGLLTGPSSIESRRMTKLTNIEFEQQLMNGDFRYKFGKIDGVASFGNQEYGSVFMNLELDYVPRIILQPKRGTNLPFYPGTKWGGLIEYRNSFSHDSYGYARAGIYDSNNYNVYEDDENGLNLDFSGPNVYAVELGLRKKGPADSYLKVGAHWNKGNFEPVNGDPKVLKGNTNFYLSGGKTIYNLTNDGERHIDASFMLLHSPSDRNLYNKQITGIIRVVGPLAKYPKDELGIGLVASFFSNECLVSPSNENPNEEYVIEVSYKRKPRPWLLLQPSFQIVRNPYGNSSRSSVYIFGFRSVINF
jgi:carbohydrate-selective porin OprB